jgi:hypothetical protein
VHHLALIKRHVQKKDEVLERTQHESRARILLAAEISKVMEKQLEECKHDTSATHESDADELSEENEEIDRVGDADFVLERHGEELLDLWGKALAELHGDDDVDEDGASMSCAFEVSNEVAKAEYNDGTEHRANNPYPEDNMKERFPQYKLVGVKALKFNLETLCALTSVPDLSSLYGINTSEA